MSRGPKRKTAQNKPPEPPRAIGLDQIEPTVKLGGEASKEFVRLVQELAFRGTLDRQDVGHITAAARAWGRLCAALDIGDEKLACQLDSVYRGYKRELSLTNLPSRSIVKTTAKSPETPEGDPIAGKIKIA
jgi:hypothetical protein